MVSCSWLKVKRDRELHREFDIGGSARYDSKNRNFPEAFFETTIGSLACVGFSFCDLCLGASFLCRGVRCEQTRNGQRCGGKGSLGKSSRVSLCQNHRPKWEGCDICIRNQQPECPVAARLEAHVAQRGRASDSGRVSRQRSSPAIRRIYSRQCTARHDVGWPQRFCGHFRG